ALVMVAGALALLAPWRAAERSAQAPIPTASVAATVPASPQDAAAIPRRSPADAIPIARDERASLDVLVRWKNGAPVPGIWVRVLPHDGSVPELRDRMATTDGDGHARFRDLDPGNYVVATDRSRTRGVTLLAHEAKHHDVTLDEQRKCEGQVVD